MINALRELRAIAENMGDTIQNPTRLKGTWWCLTFKRPHVSWFTDTQFLSHTSTTWRGSPWPSHNRSEERVQFVAQRLPDFRVLQFIFLLQDLLKVTSTLSLIFQTDGNTYPDTQDALDTECIMLNELSQGPGENYQQLLDTVDNNSYRGIELTHYGQMLQDYRNMPEIYKTVRNYVNAKLDYHADITMPMLKAAKLLDTRDWAATRGQLPGYGNDQLHVLVDQFWLLD